MRTLDINEIEEVDEAPQAAAPAMRTLAIDEIEEVSPIETAKEFASDIVNKPSPLGPSLADTAETVQDFGIGAAQGSTFGAADEIGAIGMTGLEKFLSIIPGTSAYNTKQVDDKLKAEGFKLPEESLVDTYKDYQKGSEKAFNDAAERSPIANFAGNMGGGIASGVATGKALGIFGGAAKAQKPIMEIAKTDKLKAGLELLKRGGTNYMKAAPVLAAEGALVSNHDLVGDNANPMEVAEDVGNNLLFGAAGILGMQGISDVGVPMAKKGVDKAATMAGDALDNSPFLRKAKKAFEFGEQGINPAAEVPKQKLLMDQQTRTQGLLNEIKAADKKLGQEVSKSLEVAEKAGQVLNIDAPINKALNDLNFSYDMFNDIASESRGRQIMQRISNKMGSDVTPLEAKALLDDMDAFIGKFKAANNRDTRAQGALDMLQKTRKELSDSMKKQIDGYGKASERFFDFRSNVPETILAGDKPADVKDIFMGNLRNSDDKLYDKLNALSIESSAQGSGAENILKAKGNTLQGMKQFEANELKRGTQSPLAQTSTQFEKTIRDYSDEAQMLRDMQTVKSPGVTSSNVLSSVFDYAKGKSLAGANIAGRVKQPVANLSKRVYAMPAEKLTQYATKLQNVPGLKMYGKALEDGLANGDQAKKNAALFSIMQNPSARIIFNDEEEN